MNLNSVIDIIYLVIAALLSLTFHEYAHGRVAYWLGDDTAKRMGRLTLNPIPHLDPFGTIMMVIAMTSGMGLGWAKPVPVNPMNFNGNRKRGMLWVSLAGPVSNLILALLVTIILGLGGYKIPYFSRLLETMIWVNVGLAVFNLLPVPPLDGSKILAGILPYRYAGYIYQIERYGMIALLLIIFLAPGVLSSIMGPPITIIRDMLVWLANRLAGY